jgi:hypothetical protein
MDWRPEIRILSDSSVNPRFIERTELQPGVLDGVYGVFPRGRVPQDVREVLGEDLEPDQPGFRLFAWDAASEVMWHYLNLVWPDDPPFIDTRTLMTVVRPNLLAELNKGREWGEEITGTAANYLFDGFGNNRAASYHVWQIHLKEGNRYAWFPCEE